MRYQTVFHTSLNPSDRTEDVTDQWLWEANQLEEGVEERLRRGHLAP